MRSLLFFNRKLEVATLLDDLFHEAEIQTQTDVENIYMSIEGESRGGMELTGDWGGHIHTPDSTDKIVTSENLVYSTGNHTQCPVVT